MTSSHAASQSGFTLIELVSVMILLGILAAVALPQYTGSTDFSAYSAQDQIISGARMAQQRAMYDRSAGACYRLNIISNVIRVQRIVGGTPTAIGPSEEWRSGIVVDTDVPLSDMDIYFDGLGNAINGCSGSQNSSLATVTIGSPATLNVCVNPVGYVYAC